jgi:hypothetical protein
MELILDPRHARIAYNGFLFAGLLVFYGYGWYEGRRLNLDPFGWLVTLGLLMLALVVGMHLGGMDAPALERLLVGDMTGLHRVGSSLAGGIVLFLLVGAVLWWYYRWPIKSVDRLLLAAPLAAALGRLGCLSAGCCEGLVCNGGIRYSADSGLYYRQLEAGMITLEHSTTLPVHPIPAYLIAGNLLVFLSGWLYYRWGSVPGRTAALTLLLWFLMQFGVGFFRDPAGNHLFGTSWGGLMLGQWIQLVLAFIVAAAFLSMRRVASWSEQRSSHPPGTAVTYYGIAGLLAGTWFWFPWLGIMACCALLIAWLPLLSLGLDHLWARRPILAHRHLVTGLAPAALILTVAFIPGTDPDPDHPLARRSWFEIGAGRFGIDYPRFHEQTNCLAYDDCNRCVDREQVRDWSAFQQRLLSGEISYYVDSGRHRHGFGLRGAWGRATVGAGQTGLIQAERTNLLGGGMSYNYSHPRVEVHGGLLYGRYRYREARQPADNIAVVSGFSQLDYRVRMGKLDGFYGELAGVWHSVSYSDFTIFRRWYPFISHWWHYTGIGYGFGEATQDVRFSLGLASRSTTHTIVGVGSSLQFPLPGHRLVGRVDVSHLGGQWMWQGGIRARLFL